MAKNNTRVAGVGVGILAVAAAAAAGTYFLYGKDGAKNRKKIKGWTLKAKGEILERMEKLGELSEEKYNEIITQVAKQYHGLKSVDPAELTAMTNDLRRHWKNIKRQIQQGSGHRKTPLKTRKSK